MNLFHRKSRTERVIDAVLPILEARAADGNGQSGGGAAALRALRETSQKGSGLPIPAKPAKTALAAGGAIVGLTAGSAAVSALRSRDGSEKGQG